MSEPCGYCHHDWERHGPEAGGCIECACRWLTPTAYRQHHVWLSAGRRRVCTCPLAGDHNPSAWRSPRALTEVGLTVGPGRLTPYTLCQSCGAFEHAHGRCPYRGEP